MKDKTVDKVLLLLYGMTVPATALYYVFNHPNPSPGNNRKSGEKTEEKQEKP